MRPADKDLLKEKKKKLTKTFCEIQGPFLQSLVLKARHFLPSNSKDFDNKTSLENTKT